MTFVVAEPDLHRQAARWLLAAARDRAPCAPVRDLIGSGDMAAGYAVQQLLRQEALATRPLLMWRSASERLWEQS